MKKKNLFIIGIGAVMAAAAALFFIRKKKQNADEKPPEKAPQISVDNPGEQSEFPTTASESDLG